MLAHTIKSFCPILLFALVLGCTGCTAISKGPTTTTISTVSDAIPIQVDLPPTPQPLALFLDPSPSSSATPALAPLTIRTRLVQINFDLLNNVVAPPGSSSQIKRLPLNLFGDASFIALPDRVDLNPKGMRVTGKLEGMDKGLFTLVIENQTMAGTVRVPGKLFQIRFAGNGLHAISEMDQKAFPPD